MAKVKKTVKKKPKAKKPLVKCFSARVRVRARTLEEAVELVKDGQWSDILEVVEEK